MDQTIMLIDEPPRLRDLLASILRMRGYAVLECDGGQDAMKRLRHVRPDLIIVEAILPVMSGFQMAAAVIIMVSQLPAILGLAARPAWHEWPEALAGARPFSIAVAVVVIATIMHGARLTKRVPPSAGSSASIWPFSSWTRSIRPSSRPVSIVTRTRAPSRSRPIGPPARASGPTWPMQAPVDTPEKRASVMSVTDLPTSRCFSADVTW